MQYTNPILKGDYSDPDVIRVGSDYYMISSSFTYFPGIPLLHSRDLVHWRLINYVAPSLALPGYDAPRHKRGLWAPSLRYHAGLFYVYVCTPDEGLFAYTAEDPRGAWQAHHVKDVTGWIDPCPLWDDDGQAYLLHAFAGSRAGIKSILYLHRMSPDGLEILDTGRMVFDGGAQNETTEGPKFYKHDGLYYILAPAGGVATGWQLAMRSANIYGPYEICRVLEQGDTPVNGPHQGGLIDTPSGQSWFIHFQDVGVYGRIPHLQPVNWVDGWPIMGEGGKPVAQHDVPDTGCVDDGVIPTSDDFTGVTPGLQWQWQANPNPAWYQMQRPGLRLYAAPAPSLFGAGQFLSQLMQAYDFSWTTRVTASFAHAGDRAGLAMIGYHYAYLALSAGEVVLMHGHAVEKSLRVPEVVTETRAWGLPWKADTAYLRMRVREGVATFFVSADGEDYIQIGEPFELTCGGWTGARPGIFCANFAGESGGYADFAFVNVTEE